VLYSGEFIAAYNPRTPYILQMHFHDEIIYQSVLLLKNLMTPTYQKIISEFLASVLKKTLHGSLADY
jgi:hypothetical protein